VDNDPRKIEALRRGVMPIHEPGLDDVVATNVRAGRLEFTTDLDAAVRSGRVIFIAVGTPPRADGSADLAQVEAVAAGIARVMNGRKVIVTKSTVPVGTGARVRTIVAGATKHPFAVVSNPEFLKEGAAIEDFMRPDRVIVGGDDAGAIETMRQLYAPYMRRGDRLLVMDLESAEMTKYASNCMLATRISFMNEIATLCERVGANVNHVRHGMGADVRIGGHFLFPGVGFGGSCFPKDLMALQHTGEENGVRMRVLEAVTAVNRDQKRALVEKVRKHFGGDVKGKTFALWGLAFKPGTDDIRDAPSLDIVRGLLQAGAHVRAHDPVARGVPGAEAGDDPYAILEGADGLLLVTEWNAYRSPDFERIRDLMKTKAVFDGRNIWERKFVESFGLSYYGIGV
jgi:UDPglucose 6-dehydrogenase